MSSLAYNDVLIGKEPTLEDIDYLMYYKYWSEINFNSSDKINHD